MFGKKPAPPAQPAAPTQPARPAGPAGWGTLALTSEYGVLGQLAPTETPLVGFLNIATQSTVALAQAEMQALNGAALAQAKLPEAIVVKTGLVAIIPREEAVLKLALQQLTPAGARLAMYVGPFIVRGAIRLNGDVRAALSANAPAFFALSEAEVHCQLPGAALPDLKVPLVIVNRAWVHLYHSA